MFTVIQFDIVERQRILTFVDGDAIAERFHGVIGWRVVATVIVRWCYVAAAIVGRRYVAAVVVRWYDVAAAIVRRYDVTAVIVRRCRGMSDGQSRRCRGYQWRCR